MSRAALRAPADDGAWVADPPLEQVGSLLEANRHSLSTSSLTILGRPLADLRLQVRQQAVQAARDYLAARGEPVPSVDPSAPLLMAGHQPELFHPGVWVKNFALHGLARQHDGAALNLVVDNDTVKDPSLHLPVPPASPDAYPRRIQQPFDRWSGPIPYEEATIRDPALFRGFGEKVGALLQSWGYRPLIVDFWPEVLRQSERGPHWGEAFAAARRTVERSWGCTNLEVPLSRLCALEGFAWFAGCLLADLPRFHKAHNDCLREYRRVHRLRSRSHPVPDLAAEGDWLEAPLWGWRSEQARRGPLFVRRKGDRLELRLETNAWPALPLPRPENMRQFLAAWQDLAGQGFKVRTRALTTTLFARLLVGDLFTHGIGGGKYDELTDAIGRRFFSITPPAYLVLSATLLLPLPGYPATSDDRRRLIRQLRDLRFNPDRFLKDRQDPATQERIARKQAWIARVPTAWPEHRERFVKLREINEDLSALLGEREAMLREKLADCERQLSANAVLRRRDYSFCLYPEDQLRPLCTGFLNLVTGAP